MSSSRIINFGIVGSGHIGKRHAAMVNNNPEAHLVAICDVRTPEETGWTLPDVPYFASIEEMIAEVPDMDVVCICTPNGYHEYHALTALGAKHHVVVEKPMALSKAGCERIIFKSLQVSRNVFCVMQNRYSPPSVWLKEIIEGGLLGGIFLVQINCYWNRDNRYYKAGGWKGTKDLDGGTLFTQFSHFVDIMYWLFGDITDIQARFSNFNHEGTIDFEDTGVVNFRFMNGGFGTFNYSTAVWDANLESSITIIGEKGSVKVGGQYMNEVLTCNIEGYEMPELQPSNPPNDYGPYKGSAANHHFIFDNVVDVLNERNTITTNALEGMKVVEIIERIYSLKN